MKKFVALFNVNHQREYLKVNAETKQEAEKIALSTYKDYKREGLIKNYEFVYIWELEELNK